MKNRKFFERKKVIRTMTLLAKKFLVQMMKIKYRNGRLFQAPHSLHTQRTIICKHMQHRSLKDPPIRSDYKVTQNYSQLFVLLRE